VNESSKCGIKIRILPGLGAGLDLQILSGHSSSTEVQKAHWHLVAKKRKKVNQVQGLLLLQPKQVVHDAQKWFRKLLVRHLRFDVILFNWFTCCVETVPNCMDCQRQTFVVLNYPGSLGYLLRRRSRNPKILKQKLASVFHL
jgi:hypothetical protein